MAQGVRRVDVGDGSRSELLRGLRRNTAGVIPVREGAGRSDFFEVGSRVFCGPGADRLSHGRAVVSGRGRGAAFMEGGVGVVTLAWDDLTDVPIPHVPRVVVFGIS